MKSSFKNSSIILAMILLVVLAFFVFKKISPDSERNGEMASQTSNVLPKIKIGYKLTNLDAVPAVLAHKKGYFKEQGVDAELVVLEGSEAPTAVASGKVDVVLAGPPRFYGPIEKGAPVKIIAPMSNTPAELFVRPNSGIKTYKDLEGKRVSFGSGGSTNELLLRYILTSEGVDLRKVKFLNADNQYLPSMLIEKKSLDAIFITEAGFADMSKKMGAVVMPSWVNNKYEKSITAAIVAINSDYLNNNEGAVRSFFSAMIEADRYLKNNLSDSATIIANYYKDKTNGVVDIKPEEFAGYITNGKLSYPLWDDTTLPIEMARISNELGLTKRVLTAEELYDLRFKGILETAQNEIYGATKN